MNELTQDDLVVIYLALSTQVEDCLGIMENEENKSLEMEARLVFEKSNIALDKIGSMIIREDNKPIERPKWTK